MVVKDRSIFFCMFEGECFNRRISELQGLDAVRLNERGWTADSCGDRKNKSVTRDALVRQKNR